eukprot:CAMPEP_0182429072 /NCGR_PEP_ID=MMETSP1167-20130531/25491_1 /TAXON_ID=2988 /ORGANISM="Mallomonas Sp, Strain CCMP3275" /LENGTH=178 /DNA_ID=CAMNT_0024612385 /DNA_START=137 /DNA_END=673 /DNA_ORIENTATION=-
MASGDASRNMKVATGVLAFMSSLSLTVSPVIAANYGGFGSKYTAVIDPKEAVLNPDTSSSDVVKEGIEGLKALKSSIKALQDDLAKDSQMNLVARLKSDFKIGEMRTTLNKFNTAFSEETQLASDRLIRNFLQDVTELQRESIIKEGKTRADTKLKAINKRLSAAAATLDELSSFYPN